MTRDRPSRKLLIPSLSPSRCAFAPQDAPNVSRSTRRELLVRLLVQLGTAGVCGLGETLLPRRALGAPSEDAHLEDDLRNLRLVDRTVDGRRFVLIVPKYLDPTQRLPVLVLLHGLGETTNERLGAYAWFEKYGLGSAWQRLKRPPIERTSRRGEWTDARLAEVNAELQARPFRGFVMACPFMPNPKGPGDLDAYASWIERSLIPAARAEAQTDASRTYLCGVSLGGYVSLEVLVRTPRLFRAWGGVQTAIGAWAAAGYAEKLAKAWGSTPASSSDAGEVAARAAALLILTSQQDHWRASSEALGAAFANKHLPHTYRVIPGPHDQPWLREAGTLEALLWFDRLSYAADGHDRNIVP